MFQALSLQHLTIQFKCGIYIFLTKITVCCVENGIKHWNCNIEARHLN